MTKQIINPPFLARPTGFSHGIAATGGRLLFLAGQPGLDGVGRIAAPGDLIAQFGQSLRNLRAVVEEAGGSAGDIVKLTVYVKDVRSYRASRSALGEVWRSTLGRYYPAMTLVEVTDLFDEGALVEIDGIAVIEE